MKSGYDVFWTPNALDELEKTIAYLERNFTDKEIRRLIQKIENTTALISKNPNIFPKVESNNVHRAVILRFNSMYYRLKNERIEIVSFFSNRQYPEKRKL